MPLFSLRLSSFISLVFLEVVLIVAETRLVLDKPVEERAEEPGVRMGHISIDEVVHRFAAKPKLHGGANDLHYGDLFKALRIRFRRIGLPLEKVRKVNREDADD